MISGLALSGLGWPSKQHAFSVRNKGVDEKLDLALNPEP